MTGEPRSGDIREEMSVEDDMVTISGQKAFFFETLDGKNVFSVILRNRAQFRYKLCHQAYLIMQFLGREESGKQGTELKGPLAVRVSRVTICQIVLPMLLLGVPS